MAKRMTQYLAVRWYEPHSRVMGSPSHDRPPSQSDMSEAQETAGPTLGEQTPAVSQDRKPRAPPDNGASPSKTSVAASRLATDTPGSAYQLPKASTQIQWPAPLGGHPRPSSDENVIIFRRAIGINSDLAPPATSSSSLLEQGTREPMGIYLSVLEEQRKRVLQHFVMSWGLNLLHFSQIVIGATLAALGSNASNSAVIITVMGSINTVIAGTLALLKGQGLPERLHQDADEFRKLRDWLEETDSLLATGIIGRNRKEVGVLVESAFRKYNSAKQSAESNRPENYVPDPGSVRNKSRRSSGTGSNDDNGKGPSI
ncbi:hypothetical protein VPNG_04862 [Cytospora leucostoma]|uniref:SMODS and SLOG-associating 2TM effector domain-containing protein n=1 Tax=Cytospora leucostoma TaxID=1230097 RepID=A0A423XBC7_9PEZI|nr:hypothetical protein VPNG_04862 [Cytospora leucostoma]